MKTAEEINMLTAKISLTRLLLQDTAERRDAWLNRMAKGTEESAERDSKYLDAMNFEVQEYSKSLKYLKQIANSALGIHIY